MSREYSTQYLDTNAVSSGFYNSDETGDRKYDADSIGSIFEGIVNDGVFASIGDKFAVSASSGRKIVVGSGKAWFNNTWITVGSAIDGELEAAPIIGARIDAVAIEVNKCNVDPDIEGKDRGRNGHIVIIRGKMTDDPQRPELIQNGQINQYPLAYIYVRAGITEITQADITNVVGEESTPFITGLLKSTDISELMQQWNGQAEVQREEEQVRFDTWFESLERDLIDDQAATALWVEVHKIEDYLKSIGAAEEEEY